MGIFSSIKNAIWGDDEDEKKGEAAATPETSAKPERDAISKIDVAQRLGNVPGADKLNWRTSIVDLLKLLDIDSSYANRKELAGEVGISNYEGSAKDNILLHRAVMNKLADAGGIVPDDLKD